MKINRQILAILAGIQKQPQLVALKTHFPATKNPWLALGLACLAVLVTLFLGSLVVRYLAPAGKVVTASFVQQLPGSETFISLDKSTGQAKLAGVILKAKTSRFSLANSKSLTNIKLQTSFKPGQAEVKFGVRGNESSPYNYQSLYFAPLANLTWDKLESNGLTLYQKQKQFSSVADLVTKMPADKKIGLYQVDPNQLVPLLYPNQSKPSTTVISTPIRDNVATQILVTSGDLNIKVSKQDINMYDGADKLSLILTLAGNKVQELTMADDGFVDKSKSQTAPQTASLNLPNAKPGVYKLELKFDSANNDSFISQIEINQAKVIFESGFLTWGGVPATVYTQAPKLTASTSWGDSLQTLTLDDKTDLVIKDIKNKFDFNLATLAPKKAVNDLFKITTPKGNVNLNVAGYLAFSPESYFNPQLIRGEVLSSSDTAASLEKEFDFILTSLRPVTLKDGWLMAEANFNPADLQLTGEKIFFSLEVPELDKHGGSLEIGGLDVSLSSK